MAQAAPRPLVIFLDEIDALRDEVLISVLRQLRAGYRSRPQESPYPEAAPHLVLMAFLHRVENGGGMVTREYAVNRGRLDLCLRWREDRVAMELKVWKGGRKDQVPQGLRQLDKYLSGLGLSTGWLVVFDQRPGLLPIEERTRTEQVTTPAGHQVTLLWA